jgi:hypothetical protein
MMYLQLHINITTYYMSPNMSQHDATSPIKTTHDLQHPLRTLSSARPLK